MTETAAATIIDHELSECDRVNATGRTPVVFIHGLKTTGVRPVAFTRSHSLSS